DRATPGLTAYNTPVARRLRGPLDVAALERALTMLAGRHEALRTVFETRGDSATQEVFPPAQFRLDLVDVSARPAGEREDAAVEALRRAADAPFDLGQRPGFRATIARLSADEHILLLVAHHIVSDAWSFGVIF